MDIEDEVILIHYINLSINIKKVIKGILKLIPLIFFYSDDVVTTETGFSDKSAEHP